MTSFAPDRILVPVDFSEHSAAALRLAGGFAREFGAQVRVLHVQRLDAPVYFTAAQAQALKTHLRRSLRAAHQYVEDFAAKHLPESVTRSVAVVEQDPVTAILRARRDWRADLLVMGTHGRTGLPRLRLGSVMESVFRQMSGPLLAVGPGTKPTASLGTIRRVLAPVNFHDSSRAAFEVAADIAARFSAEVIAAHVQEEPPEGRHEQAVDALCEWLPEDARSRCTVHEVVREGKPPDHIIAEAKASHADLIVLSARPRSYLGALVFGSTTEAVIRTAPCPVLSMIQR